ncbi:uncharacterized protein EI90DRAFT_3077986 [Cantharellus anzutake]|uniref:uncharacterized protein n=1 Tax=Cantharellus anzutake TaxID=1750568 RepID=UPI001904BD77|nr:uncharacterized protein EI90DRAFT_3077986 [Cantharellus anzutake]KAF8322346.1 hypothetical protein EI90DRAFT_3077986 [Cantharellus anzutake]
MSNKNKSTSSSPHPKETPSAFVSPFNDRQSSDSSPQALQIVITELSNAPHMAPPGSSLEPTSMVTPITSSGGPSHSKMPLFPLRRLAQRVGRKLSPNRDRSSIPDIKSSESTTPLEPLSGNPGRSSSSFPLSLDIGDPRTLPNTSTVHDGGASLRTQLALEGISVPPLEPMKAPRSSSNSDRKKTMIGTTRLTLQTAAFVLKFSPIPKLDQIPNLLLTLLQIYESFDENDTNLKGLNAEVQKAYETILQPLQMWTGQTNEAPPEVILLVKDFHSSLEGQIKQIRMLESQKVAERVILGAELTRKIGEVRACIASALSRFATMATTLNLLNTIRASVDYELSKLRKLDAEYHYVKSKSECLKTTRDEIRNSILNHLSEPMNRFVWLRGSPGTGKTAISMSVASILDSQCALAASFFWDKNQKGTGLDSIERFPSTLALQIAAFNAEYKSLLVKQLRQPASLSSMQGSAAEKEMKAWIIHPLRELRNMLSSRVDRIVIVLDGLDECGDTETLRSLMKLILLLDELPSTFAILVSCRPELQVVSAWDRAETQRPPIVIACEDVDKISRDDTFYTIRCMVEDGLQDCIRDSQWKPSDEDLDFFTTACRGLPIIASIRIREVQIRTESGSLLRLELEYFLNLMDAPEDLNSEYLRILRRAYMPHSSNIRPQVAKNYREVVGMMVAADWGFSVYDMSQLLGIAEDEVYSTLKPISTIVYLPSDNRKEVKFYHATAREFLVGNPIGEERDKVFFISDVKGYFLGPRLLQIVTRAVERNELDIPTELPLGDRRKWEYSRSKERPNHIAYAFQYLVDHLDPSLLFSQESNDLQEEFEQLLTHHLVSFGAMGDLVYIKGSDQVDHRLRCLVKEAVQLLGTEAHFLVDPWDIYRSRLPFTPSSSLIYKLYGHLSDPVRIFSISGEFAGNIIPLSAGALVAQKVMESRLNQLPKKVDIFGRNYTLINYEAEILDKDICNGIVTCAALSLNGRYVALGFGGGIIEVADIDNQCTISHFQNDPSNSPIWIEFIYHDGSIHLATEDMEGNITILNHGMHPVKLGTLPRAHYPPLTAVSNDGALIMRVPQNPKENWYEKMALLCVLDTPSTQFLASPPPTTQSPHPYSNLAGLSRHTIGFSPGGQYAGVYNRSNAFVWLTASCELIARFCVEDFNSWIINTGVKPPCSYLTPTSMFSQLPTTPLIPEEDAACVQHPGASFRHNLDASWLKCPFYNLAPSMGDRERHSGIYRHSEVYSSAAGRVLLQSGYKSVEIWLNGRSEFSLPPEYHPIEQDVHLLHEEVAWYGDRVICSHHDEDCRLVYLPRASKDGTRILVQGKMKSPIVIDISQVV